MDLARNPSEALSAAALRARPVSLAEEQSLPVLPPLQPILPAGGLQRGHTIAVQGGPGANALALALMAGASKSGSWVAAVGMPSLGIASAAEMGVVLERLILVATPPSARWATVVASLIDSFDLVLVNWPDATDSMVRRLNLRARDRRAVLLSLCAADRGAAWYEGADLLLTVSKSEWEGLGPGHGRLHSRRLEIRTTGRRSPQPMVTTLLLPDGSGRVARVGPPLAEPVPLGPRENVVSETG